MEKQFECQNCSKCSIKDNDPYSFCKKRPKSKPLQKVSDRKATNGSLYWDNVLFKADLPFALLNHYMNEEIRKGASKKSFKLTY